MNKYFWAGFEKRAGKYGPIRKFISSTGRSLAETGKEWGAKKSPYWKKALGETTQDVGQWIQKNPGTAGAIGAGATGLGAYGVLS